MSADPFSDPFFNRPKRLSILEQALIEKGAIPEPITAQNFWQRAGEKLREVAGVELVWVKAADAPIPTTVDLGSKRKEVA